MVSTVRGADAYSSRGPAENERSQAIAPNVPRTRPSNSWYRKPRKMRPDDLHRSGAERHAQPDLRCLQRHPLRRHGVEPDDRQQQAQNANGAGEVRATPGDSTGVVDRSRQRPHAIEGHVRIDGPHFIAEQRCRGFRIQSVTTIRIDSPGTPRDGHVDHGRLLAPRRPVAGSSA